MDGGKNEHIYFSYKHRLYKNQINNSLLKGIYLSVISSDKVNKDGEEVEHIYFSHRHLLYKNQINKF